MAKYRILLADSNNQFQTTVRDYLTAQEGIERVDTVNDGQSALDAMNNNRYDVLLCDLIMPGMDGFELLERLNSGLVKDVPAVIVISALRQEPSHVQFLPAAPQAGEKGTGKVFIFAPDANSVLENVMQLYLNNKVMSVLLDAKCGEHSARMTAMTAAADSTKSLISELDLKLNRARQAAITTEISEIVGGASALKKKKK